ncbi:hypothetical protein ACIBTP_28840 [Streptomyces avidinii]
MRDTCPTESGEYTLKDAENVVGFIVAVAALGTRAAGALAALSAAA